MILITVGTEKFPFDRLMNWLNRLINKGVLNPKIEEVVVQYGSCTIIPSQVKSFCILPGQEFLKLIAKARLIIAHCGEGTIDLLSKVNQPFILVPRLSKFGEHIDDHQEELANVLKVKGINVASSIEDLENFILSPVLKSIQISPAVYYARASIMLEQFLKAESLVSQQSNLNKKRRYLSTFSKFFSSCEYLLINSLALSGVKARLKSS